MKVDEEILMQNANRWFYWQYEEEPKDMGLNFARVWYKYWLFGTIPAVVFAPTEKEANGFVEVQNMIILSIWVFIFTPVICLIGGLLAFCMYSFIPIFVLIGFYAFMALFLLIYAQIGKKKENEYKGHIVVYFSK